MTNREYLDIQKRIKKGKKIQKEELRQLKILQGQFHQEVIRCYYALDMKQALYWKEQEDETSSFIERAKIG